MSRFVIDTEPYAKALAQCIDSDWMSAAKDESVPAKFIELRKKIAAATLEVLEVAANIAAEDPKKGARAKKFMMCTYTGDLGEHGSGKDQSRAGNNKRCAIHMYGASGGRRKGSRNREKKKQKVQKAPEYDDLDKELLGVDFEVVLSPQTSPTSESSAADTNAPHAAERVEEWDPVAMAQWGRTADL